MKRVIVGSSVVLAALIILAACASATPAPTSEPTLAPPVSLPTPFPTIAPPSSEQVTSGASLYPIHCGACHPSFAPSALARYGTALKFYDKISSSMPPTNPSGMKRQEYYDIVAYVLDENNLLPSGTIVALDTLARLSLDGTAPVPAPATALQADEQLSLGSSSYSTSCASCHPSFSPSALAPYGTAKNVYEKISSSMPPGNPGGMTRKEYYALTAYILSQGGLLPSGATVSADTAGGITLGGTAPTAQPPGSSQLQAGMAVYTGQCAVCHGTNLTDGSSGRKLSAQALATYGTARKLFDKVGKTMPARNPGSLSSQQCLDVVAYILAKQTLLADGQIVAVDTLDSTRLAR